MRAHLLALFSLVACGYPVDSVRVCDPMDCEPGLVESAPRMKQMPISVGATADIESMRVRGDTLVIRAVYRAYCEGTPPPGPTPMLVEVPLSVEKIEWKSRKRGRCKGPPRP